MVGAHLGSLEWDVDVLGDRLDRYPNFAVDLAARVCHLQVQDREKVRKFLEKYQDRVLYATDMGVSGDDFEARKEGIGHEWHSDWAYFATDSVMSSPNVDNTFTGLDLDEKILRKIFYNNALTWYPGAFD
jgi:predicted TIM-barrel fold metal-dependent hydrolase